MARKQQVAHVRVTTFYYTEHVFKINGSQRHDNHLKQNSAQSNTQIDDKTLGALTTSDANEPPQRFRERISCSTRRLARRNVVILQAGRLSAAEWLAAKRSNTPESQVGWGSPTKTQPQLCRRAKS
jgi:hypothetical protein